MFALVFHSSVAPVSGGIFPAKAKADVLFKPAPLIRVLATFKSATSVQLVPFQDSVAPVFGGSPPKAKADV